MESARPKRTRNMTEKGKALAEGGLKARLDRLLKMWEDVDTCICRIDVVSDSLELLRDLRGELDRQVDKLEQYSKDFLDFCVRNDGVETRHAAETQASAMEDYRTITEFAHRRILERIDFLKRKNRRSKEETQTVHSFRSTSSVSESCSLRAKAKAESAKAKVMFAQQEAELRKRKATLEQQYALDNARSKLELENKQADLLAEFEMLNLKREATAAEVEAEVLAGKETHRSFNGASEQEERMSRTMAYIREQASQFHNTSPVRTMNVECFHTQTTTSGRTLHTRSTSYSRSETVVIEKRTVIQSPHQLQ